MPKNINSAYRVHDILSKAIREGTHQEAMWQTFAKAFSIRNKTGQRIIFEVTRMLELFYDEIEKTKRQMEASDFSPDLYEPAFKIIEERVTPGLIHNAWGGYANELNGTLQTLKFCSEVLPNEETLMSDEQLGIIEELLQQLETKLKEGNLPEHVQALINEQIQIIRKALRDYQVIGGKAFKKAVSEGFTDYMENEETFIQYQETEELQLFMKTWDEVKDAAMNTVKPRRLLSPGTRFKELSGKPPAQ